MNKKQVKKMLEVSRILFNNSVPVEEAKIIGGFIEQLQQENQQLNEVIDEILNNAYFNNDCPYSLTGDGWVQELCDCDNCQDTYKECWLRYFKNKCKGDKNGN